MAAFDVYVRAVSTYRVSVEACNHEEAGAKACALLDGFKPLDGDSSHCICAPDAIATLRHVQAGEDATRGWITGTCPRCGLPSGCRCEEDANSLKEVSTREALRSELIVTLGKETEALRSQLAEKHRTAMNLVALLDRVNRCIKAHAVDAGLVLEIAAAITTAKQGACACCDGTGRYEDHECEVCFGSGLAPQLD